MILVIDKLLGYRLISVTNFANTKSVRGNILVANDLKFDNCNCTICFENGTSRSCPESKRYLSPKPPVYCLRVFYRLRF